MVAETKRLIYDFLFSSDLSKNRSWQDFKVLARFYLEPLMSMNVIDLY